MGIRLELHQELVEVLGSRNVYFQPPESVKMQYPCIIYNVTDQYDFYADDRKYHKKKKYDVMIISKDPDSEIPDQLDDHFKYCSFNRYYTADNLNHWVYQLYY